MDYILYLTSSLFVGAISAFIATHLDRRLSKKITLDSRRMDAIEGLWKQWVDLEATASLFLNSIERLDCEDNSAPQNYQAQYSRTEINVRKALNTHKVFWSRKEIYFENETVKIVKTLQRHVEAILALQNPFLLKCESESKDERQWERRLQSWKEEINNIKKLKNELKQKITKILT